MESRDRQGSSHYGNKQERKFDLLDLSNRFIEVGSLQKRSAREAITSQAVNDFKRVNSDFEFKFRASHRLAIPLNRPNSKIDELSKTIWGLSISEIIDLKGINCYRDRKKIFRSDGLLCSLCRKKGHEQILCPFLIEKEDLDSLSAPFRAGYELLVSLERMEPVDVNCNIEWQEECKSRVKQVLSFKSNLLTRNNELLARVLTTANLSGSKKLTQAERFLLTKLVRWKVAGANNFQLAMLGLGFRIHPAASVPEVQFGNSPLSEEYISFVRDDISSRLQKGQFVVVDRSFAKLIHPISVATKKGLTKLRLIMDKRFINFFLPHVTFTMDTLSNVVPDLIRENEELFSFDLEDAYLNVKIHSDSIPYLCFEFEGKVYACTRLFFGFSLAPLVFTKTVRMLVDLCAKLGIKLIYYIDEFLCSSNKVFAKEQSALTKWMLDFLQLRYSEKKSVWGPTKELEFLGLILNSEIREFRVPQGKLSLFQKFVGKLLNKARQANVTDTESVEVSLNNIQKILGSLQFFSLALEPAKILSRSLKHLTKGVIGKNTRVQLSESALSELRFWNSEECWTWNGKSFRSRLDLNLEFLPISLNVDASDNGWGGVLHHPDKDLCVFGSFSDSEKLLSPTERELLALFFFI